MPIAILRHPSAVHVLNNWTGDSADPVDVVRDASDTSYMRLPDPHTNEDLLYEFEDLPSPIAPEWPVTSCIVSHRVRYHGDMAQIYTSRAQIGGVPFSGSVFTSGVGTINEETHDWGTHINRVGTFNAAQFGLTASWTTFSPHVIRLQAEVSYVPPAGGFAVLILSWLGPLVAVGLHEMPGLAWEVWRRTGQWIVPGEYEATWKQMRRARHARYCDLSLASSLQ